MGFVPYRAFSEGPVSTTAGSLSENERYSSQNCELSEQEEVIDVADGAKQNLTIPAICEAYVRLEAQMIGSIRDPQTQEVVGWMYEWNTGERVPRWKNDRRVDINVGQAS